MIDMIWQVQEAKQRFSEVLRRAKADGPQIVTKHGAQIAVVLDIDDYHRLSGPPKDLNELLIAGPAIDLTDAEVDELFARDRRPSTRAVPFADLP